MERRKEQRADLEQKVTITVLSEPERAPFLAVALDMSGSGMRILSPSAVPYQAAVKVEAGDILLLGEVIRTESTDGGHMVALKLLHSLDSMGDLQRLNRALRLADQEIATVNLA